MSGNIVQDKSYEFALEVVKFLTSRRYPDNVKDIPRQLLRSATSVGANTEEAIGAQSKKDFVHKFSIVYKEARETKYWLRLMKDADLMKVEVADSFIEKIDELLRIVTSILNTSKAK